jgi:hypothetical protein
MVKVICYLYFLILFIGMSNVSAQRIEIGPRLRFGNDKFEIKETFISALSPDSATKTTVSDNGGGYIILNAISFYAKFYPKNNNQFFLANTGSTSYSHNYRIELDSNIQTGFGVNIQKRISSFCVGYDFPKSMKHKIYLIGGISYFNFSRHFTTRNNLTNYALSSDYNAKSEIVTAKINEIYGAINRKGVGFVLGFGANHGRLSEHIQLGYNPFLKQINGIAQSQTTIQFNVFYVLFHKNLSPKQYHAKNNSTKKRSKIEISSNAKFVFSIFSENGFGYIKQFRYKDVFFDTIVDKSNSNRVDTVGYVKINVDKPTLILELPGLGLACQFKIHNRFYLKSAFHFNKVRLGFPKGGNYSGKKYIENGDSTQFIGLNDNNTIMNTDFKHKQLNLIFGYSSFRRYSFFAEASIQLNSWKFNSYKIVSKDASGTILYTDYASNDNNIKEKLALKSIATTMGLTIGYKLNNILVYFQYNQSLGMLNKPNEFTSIGKLSVTRVGLAYQFYKLYAKKR